MTGPKRLRKTSNLSSNAPGAGAGPGGASKFFKLSEEASLGDKPWHLVYAGKQLVEVEKMLFRLVDGHWAVYGEYYLSPPASVLKLADDLR